MLGAFVNTPGSVQRGIGATHDGPISTCPVPASQLADQAVRAEIAELAYRVWQEQGCPAGSAESDWLEAERRIQERIEHRPVEPWIAA